MALPTYNQSAVWHDYSSPGWYYLAFETRNRRELLGSSHTIETGTILNANGEIVRAVIASTPERYPFYQTDSDFIEPNRVNLLIEIHQHRFPSRPEVFETREAWLHYRRIMGTSLIVGNIKMTSAREINTLNQSSGKSVWSDKYYDRVLYEEDVVAVVREALRKGQPVTKEMLKPRRMTSQDFIMQAARRQQSPAVAETAFDNAIMISTSTGGVHRGVTDEVLTPVDETLPLLV
jgi:hypothetical protein